MSQPIEVFPIHAFEDNYIWVIRNGQYVAVVDPGDAGPVLEFIKRMGLNLSTVLVTHHHTDHVGGLGGLIQAFPNGRLKIYGPAKENIPFLTNPLNGHEKIRLHEINLDLQVLPIPGHTIGHLAYYGQSLGANGSVFCGDTLFGAGCGRLFEGTPAQMESSLEILKQLPGMTLCYCAHEYTLANLKFAAAVEPANLEIQRRICATQKLRERAETTVPFTLEGELLTNPFLRLSEPAVQLAAAERLGHPPDGSVEVLTAIRHWKDHFRATF
jgi:hydroxyacylglutathione hydrolase